MQTTLLRPQTPSADDVLEIQLGPAESDFIAQAAGHASVKLALHGDGAVQALTASAKGTGELPGNGCPQSNAEEDASSSSSESSDSDDPDSEINAMKEEMRRYVNRGRPNKPSHGSTATRIPRPSAPPTTGTSRPRPVAVTLSNSTTAKPTRPKK